MFYYNGFYKDSKGKLVERIGTIDAGVIRLKTLKGVKNRILAYEENKLFSDFIIGVNIYDSNDNLLDTINF